MKLCKCGQPVKTTGDRCEDCLAESYQRACGSTGPTSGVPIPRLLGLFPNRNEGDGWLNPPKDIAS